MHVVDENVLVTANGGATHVGDECIDACIEFLTTCSDEETLILDDEYELVARYKSKCSYSGQPGVGDQFFVWVVQNAARLRQVTVSRDGEGRVSVPLELEDFDVDDHIYVAVARAAGPAATIVNAVDSDYQQHADGFVSVGIQVLELCEDDLAVGG